MPPPDPAQDVTAEPPFEPTAWLDQHQLPHWLFDQQTLGLLWCNEAALARYGYDRPAFLGLTRDDLLVADQVPRAHAFMAQLPHSLRQQPTWRERTREGIELMADWRGVNVRWQGRLARLVTVFDASRREQLAREQQRSRDLLQVAGRMAHIGGWSVDLVASRVVWSDEVCALHEVPAGTSLRLDEAERFYPAEASAIAGEALRRCARNGEAIDIELQLVGARGTRRWVRVVGEAVRNASGRIVGVQGAQQDITAARADRQALAESRGQLAALIAAIPDLWMVYDAEFRYERVSDPAHPGLSAPWSEKLGRRIEETVDPTLAEHLKQLGRLAHRTGQPQLHEYALTVVGGRRRWFESRYVAMPEGRTLALIRDVTETRELEQRFQDLAHAAPIGIFVAEDDARVVYANPAWCSLMRLGTEQALGLGWAGALHPDDLADVTRAWQGYTQRHEPFEMEFRLLSPGPGGGEPRTVWAQARPMGNPGDSRPMHVGCVVDVTPVRELQHERQARAVAEEAGRRQSAFLSRVSHELRTPLNAILGFGELLRGDLSAVPLQATYLGHIVQAGRHMLALVDDLLELQRIEQGRFEPRWAPLAARVQIEAVAQMLSPVAQGAAVQIQVEGDAALMLVSDERSLRQILLNLGSNAIKYGGPHLWLRCEAQGVQVLFTVRDDGPGMTPAQQQRLFQPFERLGQERGAVVGSGLGLLISRQLAEALGGSLDIASEPGTGTVATLRIPMRRGE